jgi:ribose 5-phosphate isomerase B
MEGDIQTMIYIGADHGGIDLASGIENLLRESNIACKLYAKSGDKNDDFPDFVRPVVSGVLADKTGKSKGVLVCGTGIGMSIAANHYRGIRAALCHSVEYARLSRLHNDANVLCLGGRFLEVDEANKIVNTFLETELDVNPKYKTRMNAADGSSC